MTEHAVHVYGRDWGFITKFTAAEPICWNTDLKSCVRLFRKRASQPKVTLAVASRRDFRRLFPDPQIWARGRGMVFFEGG